MKWAKKYSSSLLLSWITTTTTKATSPMMMLMMMILHNATFNYVLLNFVINSILRIFLFQRSNFVPTSVCLAYLCPPFTQKCSARPRVHVCVGSILFIVPLEYYFYFRRVISLPKSLGKSFMSSEMCSLFVIMMTNASRAPFGSTLGMQTTFIVSPPLLFESEGSVRTSVTSFWWDSMRTRLTNRIMSFPQLSWLPIN